MQIDPPRTGAGVSLGPACRDDSRRLRRSRKWRKTATQSPVVATRRPEGGLDRFEEGGLSPDGYSERIMTGKKSSREKRRKRSGQEAAAMLAAPDLGPTLASSGSGSVSGCGSIGDCGNVACCGNTGSVAVVGSGVERSERRKRRSTDSSSSVSGSVQQVCGRPSRWSPSCCIFGGMWVTTGKGAGCSSLLALPNQDYTRAWGSCS